MSSDHYGGQARARPGPGRTAGELAAALRELAGIWDPAIHHMELLEEAAAVLAAIGSRHHHVGCEGEGLYRKFDVTRNDGTDQPGGKHYGCWYFVLDPTHDTAARMVLGIYAELARIDGREPLAEGLWERPELSHNPSPPDSGVTHLAVNRMFIRYAAMRAEDKGDR